MCIRDRAVVNRHLPALDRVFRVAEELVGKVADRIASEEGDAGLAIGRINPVALLQRVGNPKLSGFLASRLHIKAESALPLELQVAIIDESQLDELPI